MTPLMYTECSILDCLVRLGLSATSSIVNNICDIFLKMSSWCIMLFYVVCLVVHAVHLGRNGRHILDRHLHDLYLFCVPFFEIIEARQNQHLLKG